MILKNIRPSLKQKETENEFKRYRMKEIKCPNDLNQFLLGEPLFENTFPQEECEMRKFYGDCWHCFATSIMKRDKTLSEVIE